MKRASILLMALILALVFMSGCLDRMTSWEKYENKEISDYIKGLGDTSYIYKTSGLYYIELKPGTGDQPAANDTVTFKYKGYFLDGVIFDSNYSDTLAPYKSVLGSGDLQVAGLDEGIRYMKAGGTTRFLTPSSLAYGHNGIPSVIPGYTPLLWEVRLLTVKHGHGR